MKTYHLYSTLVLILITLVSRAQQKDIVYTNKSFASASIEKAEVKTVGGYIHISGEASSNTTVEVILNPNGSKKSNEDLKSIFDQEYDLILKTENKTLIAHAKRKDNKKGNNPLSISFVLKVPKNTSTHSTTAGGSIKIDDLKGTQSFSTAGGSIKIANLSGNLSGQTAGGSIKANNCDGDINLSTSGGSIQLADISGKTKVQTAGGSISTSRVEGTLLAQTSGGSIELTETQGNIQANTAGGSITAHLIHITAPLMLTTSAGSIRLKVPKDGYDLNFSGSKVNLENESNFSGTLRRGSANGKLNGGGQKITATTSAGSIHLSWL